MQHEPRRLDQRAAFLPCGSHHLCCELSSSFGPEPALTNDQGFHKKMVSQKLCKISHLSTCPSLDHPPDSPVHSKQFDPVLSIHQACLGIKPEHLFSKKKRQHVSQRLVQNKNCMKQFAIFHYTMSLQRKTARSYSRPQTIGTHARTRSSHISTIRTAMTPLGRRCFRTAQKQPSSERTSQTALQPVQPA